MTILKWLRVIVALTIFCVLSWFFVVIDKDSPNLHQLAQMQLVQSLLVGTFGVVAFWIIIAFLFGRVYCSAICPFGVMQDVFSRITKLVRGKKRKFQFRKAMTKTRLTLLVVFVTGLLAFPAFVTILDPYSNYGRIISSTTRPAYRKVNDVLAKREHEKKNYDTAFRIVDEYARLVHRSALVTALIALGVIGTLSMLYGRRYCNTICPVGTFLGLLSRFSRFQVRLKHNCISCGLCTAACKGECIDAKNKTVDASRCVACFNCLSTCKRDAIAYSLPLVEEKDKSPEKLRNQASVTRLQNEVSNANPEAGSLKSEAFSLTDSRRRRFLRWSVFSLIVPTVAGILAKKAKLVASSTNLGVTQGEGHAPYQKTLPVIPPGARSIKRYMSKCTGCHLCVSKCPAGIITPSTFELGLSGFMQPILDFDTRYCDDGCNICTLVCPSHALQGLTVEEKNLTSIGKAVFMKENCVVHTLGENCASCDEHCPTKAIKMVSYDPARNLVIPQVDRELCIGCGACEHACPIRPYRGIYVDGLAEHEPAKPASDPNAKQEDISETIDFPF